jgi:hypothetical protein
MRAFHRTTLAAARAIVAGGFVDGTDRYGTNQEFSGVWLSSHPIDANEGARGDALLSIEIPDELFQEFEWVEVERTRFREALIPAEQLNRFGRPVLEKEEVER